MTWESIGSTGSGQTPEDEAWILMNLGLARAFINHVCGRPPDGCSLDIMWHEHELGNYPSLGIWSDSEPPWRYINACERALEVFDDAVDWTRLREFADGQDHSPAESEEWVDEDDSCLSEELLVAYRATDYVVFVESEVHVHVDRTSPQVESMMRDIGARSAVIVTAWNPFSRPLSDAENDSRNELLRQRIAQLGLQSLSAEGRDPSGQWKAEQSFLAFDVSTDMVDSMLVEFEQNAVVLVDESGSASLLLHPCHRRRLD
jgi:hypothetical protein